MVFVVETIPLVKIVQAFPMVIQNWMIVVFVKAEMQIWIVQANVLEMQKLMNVAIVVVME